MLDRRQFLSSAASGVAASLCFRGSLLAQLEKTPPLPDRSLLDSDEDAYWAEMRRQFIIPDDARRRLADPHNPARFEIRCPHYQHQSAPLGEDVRQSLLDDLQLSDRDA